MVSHPKGKREPWPAFLSWDPDPTWRDWAACRGTDTDQWVKDGATGYVPATLARICARCPVQRRCLAYAIVNRCDGVWAGTSRAERDRLRRLATW